MHLVALLPVWICFKSIEHFVSTWWMECSTAYCFLKYSPLYTVYRWYCLTRGLATLPKGQPGSCWGRRKRWKTPKRTLAVNCFCVYSASGWEISLGQAGPWNVNFGPTCLILGFSWACLLYHIVFYNFITDILLRFMFMCWLFWFSCQYLSSDWLESLL